MKIKVFFIGLLFVCLQAAPVGLWGQNPASVEQGREILRQKGITEEELRQRLIDKGYNPDDVKPEDLPEFQRIVEETVLELEAEKRKPDTLVVPSQPPAPPAKEPTVKKPESVSKDTTKTKAQDKSQSGIYGHDLFKSETAIYYKQGSEIPPPETYVIGVGDRLTVSIFGQSQHEENLVVDRQGYVRPTDMFRISLQGKTLGEARDILAARYRAFYIFNAGEFDVTVNTVRSITINIMGEAESTGAITLPAINTVFNALVAAGGPSPIGSVRKIRQISGDKIKVFDLYKYMVDPREAENFYLKANDYIQVPVSERVVSIVGAVRRPLKYELIEGEQLKDLIAYAGGLKADAYLGDVRISRYSEDQRVVINLNLRTLLSGNDDFILYNGDEIEISMIEQPARNFAEITGAVVKEGQFALEDDMRISDLLSQSGIRPDARTDVAYILRFQPDGSYVYESFGPASAIADPDGAEDPRLFPRDRVHILSLAQFADKKYISIAGSVRNPGRYAFDPGSGMQVQDAILVAGGAMATAGEVAYIVRRRSGTTRPEDYIAVNLDEAMAASARNREDFNLQPFDSIYIFDQTRFLENFTVEVTGEVHRPGEFDWDESLTLTDVLRMAGGLTFKAAYNRVDISRVILSETDPTTYASFTATIDSNLNVVSAGGDVKLNPFDHIFVRSVPDFKLQRLVTVLGEVVYPGKYPITSDNEKISSIVRKAGGLNDEAYAPGARLYRTNAEKGTVVIQLDEALRNPASDQNLILEAGDELYIPRREDLVTIEGAVRLKELYQDEFLRKGNRINVVYVKGKNAKYYIDNYAAGVSETGSRKLITVEHPNGRISRTTNLGLFRVYPKVMPGSTINVGRKPEKAESEPGEEEKVDWPQVFRDTLAQATAVLTLILLIDRATD